MRKIFIDGGANNGCSTNKFIKEFKGANEYEVYMFEANPQGCTRCIEKKIKKYLNNNITYIPKAIWTHDMGVNIHKFGAPNTCHGSNTIYDKQSSITQQRKLHKSIILSKFKPTKYIHSTIQPIFNTIESVCLSRWIKSNFSKDDYIILKLDIEGAEYNVIEDLYKTDVLSYINELHGELHGMKRGFNINDDLKLLERLKKYNLKLFHWYSFFFNDKANKEIYTTYNIEENYKSYENKKVFHTKPDWDILKQYRNNYKEWYNENM